MPGRPSTFARIDAVTSSPLQQVDDAIDALLAAHDPTTDADVEFRGARYDAGLAWVHFPVGFGGLGLRPDLNRHIERRLREAGAAAADPRRRSSCTSPGRRSSPTATTSRSDASCGRCSPARSAGASCSPSREPAPTSPGSPPARSATATSGSSTARRCGTRSPTSPTGACSSPAATPTCPSTRA